MISSKEAIHAAAAEIGRTTVLSYSTAKANIEGLLALGREELGGITLEQAALMTKLGVSRGMLQDLFRHE